MRKQTSPVNTATLLFLHAVLLLYSLCSVCSKTAAVHTMLSLPWLFWYGLSLLGLFLYALLWQQVLKRMPLTVAFANKSVTVVWGILWSALLFGETPRPSMLIGTAIIVVGICLVGTCDE